MNFKLPEFEANPGDILIITNKGPKWVNPDNIKIPAMTLREFLKMSEDIRSGSVESLESLETK